MIIIFYKQYKKGHDKDFYSILTQVECDVLLLFGKDDPWCTPAFAKRMYQSLKSRHDANIAETKKPVHRYVELDNVGHCPNHEAPQAVGLIASRWTSASQRHRQCLNLLNDNEENIDVVTIKEPWGDVSAREINDDEINLSLVDKVITSLV